MNIVITGTTSGIGAATAEALAEKSELYRQQALANAFQVAGGRSGGADDGTTYLRSFTCQPKSQHPPQERSRWKLIG